MSGCSKNEKLIVGFADAQKARIGVMTGSTGEAVAAKRFPKAQVKSFDDIMDAVAAIKSGQLDAIITLFPAALQVSKKNPELRILPEPLDFEDTAIAVRKDNDQLLATVDRIVAALKADGTLADMEKRWLKPDLSPYQELDVVPLRQGKILKIGVSATREPFSFVDDHGRVSGFDGELARIIAVKLQRPVEFFNMKFMALIPALQSGKVDLIISGMTATSERKKTVNFTQPYFANKQVMLVRKPAVAPLSTVSDRSELSTLNSLKGKRICVLPGSAGEMAARQKFSGSQFQVFTAAADAALAITTNKADAFVYDKSVLLNLAEKNPELMILDQAVDKLEVAAALRKDNTALLSEMNKALQSLKQEGELQRLRTKWVDTKYTATPQLQPAKAVHTSGVLRMGTCANLEPFSFQSNGIITGLDRELSQLLGERLNKKIEIIDMNFEALIPALQSGKIDFALSNFNVTEERKKLINFSVPYITNDISVLVRKTGSSATTAAPSFFSDLVTSFQSNIIHEMRYLLILDGLKTTVVISVFATLFGTLLGALICFMRMAKSRLLSAPARLYIAILRGTPVLVLLMLIFYVVFASINISPVIVAVIAFGMNFGAYTAEIFRTGIEGVEKGQTEAGISLGFTRTSTFLHIVLPQMVRRILPVYKGEFISLVKMTSIVGYIAVQDLTKASDIIRSRTFDAFFPLVMVAILYFLISWTLMQSLEYLERITDPKYKKRKAGRA
ncbi:ABC transporter permease subunit [Trichlorobacter lovleyi]|nr:ABC transporter permease subunit [Trichlorobacter lovleyi]